MRPVLVTRNAWNKMSNILSITKNKYGFIYSASSGGCNGFNFELNLLEKKMYNEIKKNRFYTVLSEDNTKLYIDPISEMYLLGTTIDYIHEDYQNGTYESKFHFGINKEKMTNCGCGISFNLK
tara:strand:- start:116 stop:484 length:369 start_codon:yes stop_codon:yes gene_type:complete